MLGLEVGVVVVSSSKETRMVAKREETHSGKSRTSSLHILLPKPPNPQLRGSASKPDARRHNRVDNLRGDPVFHWSFGYSRGHSYPHRDRKIDEAVVIWCLLVNLVLVALADANRDRDLGGNAASEMQSGRSRNGMRLPCFAGVSPIGAFRDLTMLNDG